MSTAGDRSGGDDLLASLYHPTRARSFDADECFLCGARLDQEIRTDEHVFPKWVLNEFDLWNSKLDLLNGTPIPYRQLVIPCCRGCNTGHLSDIESQVQGAYREGVEGFRGLDRNVLFLWLAKILYGLLVRELFLLVDRTRPDDGPIVSPDVLRELRLHHLLLQASRGLVTWSHSPASIVIMRTKVSPVPSQNFDFADSPAGPTLTMRLGPIGILAVLQDWGCFERSQFVKVERVRDHPLAPFQFRELMAFTRYAASKFRLNPAIMVGGPSTGPQEVTLIGSLAGSAYHPFESREIGALTAYVLGVPVDAVVVIDDRNMQWLVDDDGNPVDAPFEAAPGPAPG